MLMKAPMLWFVTFCVRVYPLRFPYILYKLTLFNYLNNVFPYITIRKWSFTMMIDYCLSRSLSLGGIPSNIAYSDR